MIRFRAIVVANLTVEMLVIAFVFSWPALAQTQLQTDTESQAQSLANEEWLQLESDHFTVVSQLSSRQSQRLVQNLETWRNLAAEILLSGQSPPAASVPNYVYLFSDSGTLRQFYPGQYSQTSPPGFFLSTPRANFMALLVGDDDSLVAVLHHYAHFLIRNSLSLDDQSSGRSYTALPRWYEEGLAGYLARMEISGNSAEFDRYSERGNSNIQALGNEVSMEKLLFQNDALASPRTLQIANLKSESLLFYLLHGYLESDYPDRRDQLKQYLSLLQQGRNPRFAYEFAFGVTTEQLEQEFGNYLLKTRRPRVKHDDLVVSDRELKSEKLESGLLAVLLGELALNSGNFDWASELYRYSMAMDSAPPRAYSGYGDAIRMAQKSVPGTVSEQQIAAYFEQALSVDGNNLDVLLDYGEYWESELVDCDKVYSTIERNAIKSRILEHFQKALQLAPDNAEVNLALAQFYLLPGEQWQQGLEFQRRAFELLPADDFIMEQAARYEIEQANYQYALELMEIMAIPLHFFEDSPWLTQLRQRMQAHQDGKTYDACAP